MVADSNLELDRLAYSDCQYPVSRPSWPLAECLDLPSLLACRPYSDVDLEARSARLAYTCLAYLPVTCVPGLPT